MQLHNRWVILCGRVFVRPSAWVVVCEVAGHALLSATRGQQFTIEANLPLTVVALILEGPVECYPVPITLSLNNSPITVNQERPRHLQVGCICCLHGFLCLFHLFVARGPHCLAFVEKETISDEAAFGLGHHTELRQVPVRGYPVLVFVARLCAEPVLVPRPTPRPQDDARPELVAATLCHAQQAADGHHGGQGLPRKASGSRSRAGARVPSAECRRSQIEGAQWARRQPRHRGHDLRQDDGVAAAQEAAAAGHKGKHWERPPGGGSGSPKQDGE
mmetsp:Transcript_103827/g.320236  ORF Transcript_103827/g.320236 Transcript_103827/m.320236 type:complete len:275 (+) Transcript_103827:510-1334(+)